MLAFSFFSIQKITVFYSSNSKTELVLNESYSCGNSFGLSPNSLLIFAQAKNHLSDANIGDYFIFFKI